MVRGNIRTFGSCTVYYSQNVYYCKISMIIITVVVIYFTSSTGNRFSRGFRIDTCVHTSWTNHARVVRHPLTEYRLQGIRTGFESL